MKDMNGRRIGVGDTIRSIDGLEFTVRRIHGYGVTATELDSGLQWVFFNKGKCVPVEVVKLSSAQEYAKIWDEEPDGMAVGHLWDSFKEVQPFIDEEDES
jgi:hypothetical protein